MSKNTQYEDGRQGQRQRQGNRDQRRQVIPDVTKSAEFMGISIMGLMRAYMPAMSILFYGINLAPDGTRAWFFVAGMVVTAITTIIVLAAPSDMTPGQYARHRWRQATDQGVLIHE